MKKSLRKEILAARQAMTEQEWQEKSLKIKEALESLPEYSHSKVILMYIDFRKEVAMGPVIVDALAQGKRVLAPITDIANRKLTPSELLYYPGDLTSGAYGILEPKPECVRPVDVKEIDMVLVPGVGFDEQGYRLGYGGGFYDRFLERTREDTVYVAPVFELQVRAEVHKEPHDAQMHYVITEKRVIKTKD